MLPDFGNFIVIVVRRDQVSFALIDGESMLKQHCIVLSLSISVGVEKEYQHGCKNELILKGSSCVVVCVRIP